MTGETETARVEPPDPREVSLERCVAEIERELGPLGLYQRIAVIRAVEAFADSLPTSRDPWC